MARASYANEIMRRAARSRSPKHYNYLSKPVAAIALRALTA
ncbi:hypothetical protein BURMUCGD2M_3141 [Burkholderia multivorans CGD2M]|uniref:Uncharacterized protein n=1 Tax=Burkholderia multivorans CGD2 TaxID=513052 RepID=B9C0K0_9BURK|nr:hypothetical protein BURMUCGD2_3057 [Burkholderia multivorans CGD2]EEE10250.1 hypothetical protein BURMUCGD2M_3141 [Burkholderia multivorans CGD2M]